MTTTQEKLELMKTVAYNQIGVVFNSEGKPLSKKELKNHIKINVLGKLNFAIGYAQKKDIEYSDLIDIKELLTS